MMKEGGLRCPLFLCHLNLGLGGSVWNWFLRMRSVFKVEHSRCSLTLIKRARCELEQGHANVTNASRSKKNSSAHPMSHWTFHCRMFITKQTSAWNCRPLISRKVGSQPVLKHRTIPELPACMSHGRQLERRFTLMKSRTFKAYSKPS